MDASGNLYVADTENHRAQKCTPSGATTYTCSTFAGETGVFGDDFGHLHPLAVAVDREGRVYVADVWNNRVQVFDATGAYLTTVGGSWDSTFGGPRNPTGVAVDSAGNLYVADSDNHRVQKFAPGYPGWRQANINGFGDPNNSFINLATGADVWRTADGTNWQQVARDGWGDRNNITADYFDKGAAVFNYPAPDGQFGRAAGPARRPAVPSRRAN